MIMRSALRFFSESWAEAKGFYWDMGPWDSVEVPVREGMRFRFTRYGDVARMLYTQSHLVRYGKSFETGMLDRFCGRLAKGATVIDVGANVGMYSITASRLVGPEGLVLAYEPDPATFRVLQRNLELNGCSNVQAFPLALSDRSGRVSLSVPEAVQASYTYGDSYHSMTMLDEGSSDGISCVALDAHLTELGIQGADVMKVDVEGAELACLKGAAGLLMGELRPFLMVECDESLCTRFGNSVFDTLSYLGSKGYALRQVAAHDWVAMPKA